MLKRLIVITTRLLQRESNVNPLIRGQQSLTYLDQTLSVCEIFLASA